MSNKHTTVLDVIAAICVIGMVAVCLFISAAFISSYQHAKDSVSWPHVKGTVSQSANPLHIRNARDTETMWYEYVVDGKKYTSCRVRFFEPNTLSGAQRGAEVQIFYDPKHPQEACLVPGISGMITNRIFALLGLLGVGIFSISYFIYEATLSPHSEGAMTRAARKRAQIAFQNREWLHYT